MGWAARANTNPLRGMTKPPLPPKEDDARRMVRWLTKYRGTALVVDGEITEAGEKHYYLVAFSRTIGDTVRQYRKVMRRVMPARG